MTAYSNDSPPLPPLTSSGCADTRVGDDLTRGISGGERKRLTVGEGLLTNARFIALDEVSTGAFIARVIRASNKALFGANELIASLVQDSMRQ